MMKREPSMESTDMVRSEMVMARNCSGVIMVEEVERTAPLSVFKIEDRNSRGVYYA